MYASLEEEEEQYVMPYDEYTEQQQYEFANPAFQIDSGCTPSFVAVMHHRYGVVYDSDAPVVSHMKDFPHALTRSFNNHAQL